MPLTKAGPSDSYSSTRGHRNILCAGFTSHRYVKTEYTVKHLSCPPSLIQSKVISKQMSIAMSLSWVHRRVNWSPLGNVVQVIGMLSEPEA